MAAGNDAPTELLELTAVATAVTYFAGWEWARAFYQTLGIPPGLLEFPTTTYFVWASRPIEENWYWALAALVAILALNHYRRLLTGWRALTFNAISLAALLALFPAASWLARDSGLNAANQVRRDPHDAFPLVTLHLKDPDTADRNALRERSGAVHGDRYFLVGLHRGMYYMLPRDSQEGPYAVPADSVAAIIYRR